MTTFILSTVLHGNKYTCERVSVNEKETKKLIEWLQEVVISGSTDFDFDDLRADSHHNAENAKYFLEKLGVKNEN